VHSLHDDRDVCLYVRPHYDPDAANASPDGCKYALAIDGCPHAGSHTSSHACADTCPDTSSCDNSGYNDLSGFLHHTTRGDDRTAQHAYDHHRRIHNTNRHEHDIDSDCHYRYATDANDAAGHNNCAVHNNSGFYDNNTNDHGFNATRFYNDRSANASGDCN
jgi:hypothetical protein